MSCQNITRCHNPKEVELRNWEFKDVSRGNSDLISAQSAQFIECFVCGHKDIMVFSAVDVTLFLASLKFRLWL
jgi:hypothetical protein